MDFMEKFYYNSLYNNYLIYIMLGVMTLGIKPAVEISRHYFTYSTLITVGGFLNLYKEMVWHN